MRKPRHMRSRRNKVGAPPGTLVHIGERKVEQIRIHYLDYTPENIEEGEVHPPEAAKACELKGPPTITWINIDGIHDVQHIEVIGNCFHLHPLVQEDILNTEQRPKLEDYDTYLFLVLKMLHFEIPETGLHTEQVSLVFGRGYVLSFQEMEGDVFNGVRERLRSGKGRIRQMGSDYLAYALLDSVVDSYFLILEKMGYALEELEDELITCPTPQSLEKIHRFKRDIILLRRSIWPLREVVSSLMRSGSPLVKQDIVPYLKDVYDHTIQVMDTVESYRDLLSSLLDLYLSSVSNRMNEVMKVLTVIATIFIPLTFIVGVYGMNFDFMPELEWKWSYPILWLIMVGVGVGMTIYFKRKKWL